MLVIIPHPNQEAKIKAFQKELCDSINSNNQKVTKLFPTFPLWFEFEQQEDNDGDDGIKQIAHKDDLKGFAGQILGVELNIRTDYTTVPYFIITVHTEKKDYTAALPVFIEYKALTACEKDICLKKINSSELLPMSLKIFRLGNKQQLTEHSQALDYFIWKKLI